VLPATEGGVDGDGDNTVGLGESGAQTQEFATADAPLAELCLQSTVATVPLGQL